MVAFPDNLDSSTSTVRFKNVSPTNSVKSNYSRPPSVDNLFPEATTATQVPLAKMDQAKCAVGAACLDDKLLVCGEFLLPCKQICSRSEAVMCHSTPFLE